MDDSALASKGIVTTNLISLDEISQVLHEAKIRYYLDPVFNTAQLSSYYLTMDVFFAHKTIILLIPMASKYHFHHFKYTPFPTYHDNETIILNTNKIELLISINNRYFTEASKSDFDECQTISTIRLCKSNILPLYNSIEKDSCLLHLLFSPVTLSAECKYTVLKADSVQTVMIQNVLFVYKPNRDNVRVECGDDREIISLQSFSLQPSCSLFGADYRIVGRKEIAITFTLEDINPNWPKC